MRPQILEFVPIAETLEWRFLSITAAARLPAQQPKSQSAFAAHGRYSALGSIYYAQRYFADQNPQFLSILKQLGNSYRF